MNKFLLSLGLAFLALSIVGLFIRIPLLQASMHTTGKIPLTQPIGCGYCGGGGSNSPFLISKDTIDQDLFIKYEWPKHMNINGSESISVALTVTKPPSNEPSPTPIGNVGDRGESILNPDSLKAEEYSRCPGDARTCLLSNLFGNGYTMSIASAYMIATSFEVQLMGPSERSTDQPLIEWDWNISPKLVGVQVLTVGVYLEWTPTGKGGGTPILRQLWESLIPIEVDNPLLDVGQVNLSTAFSGVFGSVFTGVSIPWMLGQWHQKREKKKQKIKFCRDCGAENPADFEYCNKCGKLRTTVPDAIASVQSMPSAPIFTEETRSSVGTTAVVQHAPASSSSQENGKK